MNKKTVELQESEDQAKPCNWKERQRDQTLATDWQSQEGV